jgi:foldase protein PrsA
LLRSERIPARICAAALAAVAAVGLSACGEDVPSGAVAKVGDEVITKEEFNRFLQITARQQSAGLGGGATAVPDPPTYAKCIQAKQGQPSQPGAPKPSTDQLKRQCEQEYKGLKDQTMSFLVQSKWLLQEAEEQGVKVTDAEVRKRLDDEKKQAFPKEEDYQKYLRDTGQTEQDILLRVRLSVLTQQLQQKVVENEGNVSDADVREAYEKNKKDYAQPETRDLLVVLARDKGQARKALDELRDGKPWKDVVKKYSQDQATKSEGGKLPAVTRGQQEKAFDDAIFGAKRDEIVGPIKTQFGWYVFRVTKITQARQQPFEQVAESIRNQLRSQRQQEVLNDFVKDYEKRHTEETKCDEDYLIPACDNSPDKGDDTPASGQPPQQAPPQGPPGAPVPQVPPQGAPPQGAPPQQAPPQGAPPQGAPPQQAPPQGAPPQAP